MKQTATFGRFVGVGEHPHSGEMNVTLADVDGHPKLGRQRIVHTSLLHRIGYSPEGEVIEVETRNTIYRLRGYPHD